jgi:hypothetical protein
MRQVFFAFCRLRIKTEDAAPEKQVCNDPCDFFKERLSGEKEGKEGAKTVAKET